MVGELAMIEVSTDHLRNIMRFDLEIGKFVPLEMDGSDARKCLFLPSIFSVFIKIWGKSPIQDSDFERDIQDIQDICDRSLELAFY